MVIRFVQVLQSLQSLPYKGPDGRPLSSDDLRALTQLGELQASTPEGQSGDTGKAAKAIPRATHHHDAESTDAVQKGKSSLVPAAPASTASIPRTATLPAHASPATASASAAAATDKGPSAVPHRTSSSSPYTIIQYTTDGKQIPYSNGGVGPGYWWAQTLQDLTLYAALPQTITGKDVLCTVTANKLTLQLKGHSTPIIQGPLYAAVKHTEAVWNVESRADAIRRPVDVGLVSGSGGVRREHVRAATGCGAVDVPVEEALAVQGCAGILRAKLFTLTLDKVQPTWWLRVVTEPSDTPCIDGTQVDSTQHISTYDEDTQAAIRKIMFDQSQKVQGLPTSEELDQARMLEAARMAPGSPFLPGGPLEGQPFELRPGEAAMAGAHDSNAQG